MASKAKIFLVILVCFTLALLAFNFFYFPKQPFLPKLFLADLVKKSPILIPEAKQTMFLPVRRSDLGTIPESAAKSTHLVFFLPDKAPVYALFVGKVTRHVPAQPPNVPFENIFIQSQDNRYVASYIFEGRTLVEEGQAVNRGSLVVEVSKDKGIPCLGGGNLGIYLFKDDAPTALNKEMLKQLRGSEDIKK